jgi:putative ABC transport system substrate-binding protein
MRRRAFIGLLGGAAAWPLAARAQAPERRRRIGVLMAHEESNREAHAWLAAFRESLERLGWKENGNIRSDYRWGTADLNVLQRAAKELVALQPDLILTSSTPSTAALLRETHRIPIVFANIVDPVGAGFVASLSRPGGNVTGFLNLEFSIAGKWLGLLKEISPRLKRVVIPFHPATAPFADSYLDHFNAAAQSLEVEVRSAPAHDIAAHETFVAAQANEPNVGFIAFPGAFTIAHRAELVAIAARHRLPAVYYNRAFAQAGGLLSYGNDIRNNYRRAAGYADRILKGEKASDLPVQFPVNFQLVINLRTAKALGLQLPPTLISRADEVIE